MTTRYARLGWLATTLLLAVALAGGSWANYRAASAAVGYLHEGQAEVFESAVRASFPPWERVDSAQLADFLDQHEEAGLRYIAMIDARGAPTWSAGESTAPLAVPERAPNRSARFDLVVFDERIRAFAARPMVAAGREGARSDTAEARVPGGPAPRDGGGRGRGRSGGPPEQGLLVLEFEPVVASAVVSRATRTMVVGWVGALILGLVALRFWRSSVREELARIREEEQKRLTQLGQMSAVMAHEIRNPLASLKGHAQLLAERLAPETRERARADRVVGEATRLESLTSDLLDFVRTGSVTLRETDPGAILRASVDEVDGGAFEVDLSGAPGRWVLDAPRLRHALVNLLRNAQQASADRRAAPRVRVTCERGELVFEVRDFGPGLPPGAEARIFEPFVTTRTNGTGLGLAVVKRIVELHDGRIAASNHPEGGAVFRMTLPARAARGTIPEDRADTESGAPVRPPA